MADIFLSYSSRDRARARVVADGLESLGWTVWWDRKLVPGEPYPKDIEDQLATVGCVVVLWSARSVRSEWVQREAAAGQQRNMLVPAFIDDVAGKLPKLFNEIHASRLTDWEGDPRDPQFVAMQGRIAALIDKAPAAPTEDRRRIFQRFRRQVISAFRVPAWPPQLVLADWIVAGLLAAAIAMQVGWAWRVRFNGGEKWLWGTALVAGAWVWYLARRVRLRPRWHFAPVAFLMMVGRMLLIVGITAAWGFAARNLYASAPFSGAVNGFYVARLDGDPSDKFQTAIVDSLRKMSRSIGLGDSTVRRLPERVSTDERARAVGIGGKAALVLWGKVSPASSGAQITAHVAIMRDEGMYESAHVSSAVVGADVPELPLASELATLQRALMLFFAGYTNYHGKNSDDARTYFDSTRLVLEAAPGKSGAIDGTLGSVRFYLGNLSAGRGDTEEAIAHYHAAIAKTFDPILRRSKFVEPLNNLAFLLIRRQRADSAVGYLRQAIALCGAPPVRASCPYVHYNIGVAHIELGKYDSAVTHLTDAINASRGVGRRTHNYRFLAYVRQQIAYAHVKEADGTDETPRRLALYRKAAAALDESETSFRQGGSDTVPARFGVTRARILVGLQKWEDAIALLGSDRIASLRDPDAYLLLAIAYNCTGKLDDVAPLMTRYVILERNATRRDAGRSLYTRTFQWCRP